MLKYNTDKNRKKLIVFHPALAPYRIDILNSFYKYFDTKFYFSNKNLMNQKFDQTELKKQVNFECNYLKIGFNFRGRSFRFDIPFIILKNKPDLVLSTEFNIISLLSIFSVKIFSRKTKIFTLTEDNIDMVKNFSKLNLFLRKYICSNVDGVIVVNNKIEKWYMDEFKVSCKMIVLPTIREENKFLNSLNASEIIANEYIKKYDLSNKKTVLYVGRFTEVKNLELLIEAFNVSARKHKNSVLILVGSGELTLRLKNVVKKFKLEKKVLFPGRFEGLELLAWYKISDSFILPSTYEPFGAVINEALLAGCYSAVSKLAGGASLIINGQNGVTFNPFSVDDISTSLDHLFERSKPLNKSSLMAINYDETFKQVVLKLK
jgi:glycosyltransferase involved in cell wall biosynthesis